MGLLQRVQGLGEVAQGGVEDDHVEMAVGKGQAVGAAFAEGKVGQVGAQFPGLGEEDGGRVQAHHFHHPGPGGQTAGDGAGAAAYFQDPGVGRE